MSSVKPMLNSKALEIIRSEIWFQATRSSGAGGQNVNRTESAVILYWLPEVSRALSAEQKARALPKLASRMNAEGELQIRAEVHRDQLSNKKAAFELLIELLNKALVRPKVRIATRPTRAAKEKRLQGKKRDSEIKSTRKRVRI